MQVFPLTTPVLSLCFARGPIQSKAGALLFLRLGMAQIARLGLLLGFLVGSAAFGAAFDYANPLPFTYSEGQEKSKKEVRDPCITRVGDTYYLVFTMSPFSNYEVDRVSLPDQGGSPGIALYSSKDLKAWRFENWLVKSSELAENCPYKDRFWAPEIHQFGSKFYLIFTADNWIKNEHNSSGKIGIAGYPFVSVADRIQGPYRHFTYIEKGACDTTLFSDAEGRTYAAMPKNSIFVRQIDLSGLEQGVIKWIGAEKLAVACENTDICNVESPRYLEGPWVERIGSKYYLFHAANYKRDGGTMRKGYWTNVAYAENPLGPWTKDPRAQLFEGGHLAAFDGPGGGKWFAYRGESRNSCSGLLCVDPFQIAKDGTVLVQPTIGARSIPLR